MFGSDWPYSPWERLVQWEKGMQESRPTSPIADSLRTWLIFPGDTDTY